MKTLLLGIGALRAGTTWLFDYLSRHPQVHGGPIKAFHFWDEWFRNDGASWRRHLESSLPGAGPQRRMAIAERLKIIEPADYFAHFDRHSGDKPYVLDMTSTYALMSAARFEAIARHANAAGYQVQVVYVLRDPIEHHRSVISHLATTQRGSRDFVSSLETPVADHSRYHRTLSAVITVFPGTIVGFFESTIVPGDPEAVMMALGLPPLRVPDDLRRHRSEQLVDLADDDIAAGMRAFMPAYEFVGDLYRKPPSWRA